MKRLLLILILTFSFQTLTKADDIRDFQLEGMSLGDSLLDFYTEKEIRKNLKNYYNDKDYLAAEFDPKNLDYSNIQVHFKNDDEKFPIYALDGLFLIKNMKQCIDKKNDIANKMSSIFNNAKREDRPDAKMASGHGVMPNIKFLFTTGDFAEVTCYDYNERVENEKGWTDHGRVSIVNKKLDEWIINKAHK
tara:strand:+ start:34 stop:606 length:573 start_codon:yes stop_codon:yes gene_type:complete